jgi:DNA-binding transcriptional ArsR family regulator
VGEKTQQAPVLVTAPGPDAGHDCIATEPVPPGEGVAGLPHARVRHAPAISDTRLEIAKDRSCVTEVSRLIVPERRMALACGFPGTVGRSAVALPTANRCVMILNHMVQSLGSRLDASFAALSDPTRRGVLAQLGRADASITDLAEKFHMTLTGMKKHVGVLEQAGLVMTEKVGRVRTCKLGLRRLNEEAAWIERHRQLWDARFDELDKVVDELKRKEKVDGRKKSE